MTQHRRRNLQKGKEREKKKNCYPLAGHLSQKEVTMLTVHHFVRGRGAVNCFGGGSAGGKRISLGGARENSSSTLSQKDAVAVKL